MQLQAKLVEIASTQRPRQLRRFCEAYKDQIAVHAKGLNTLPEGVRKNPAKANVFVQSLGAAAECLAQELGDSTLWNVLVGNSDNNPIIRWQGFIDGIAERMQRLEHKQLIAELQPLLTEVTRFEGGTARQYEAILRGRLGELLYHSGNMEEARVPMEEALSICQKIGDREGVCIYLNNLIEIARYQGDRNKAIKNSEELLAELRQQGKMQLVAAAERQLRVLQSGEPACRLACRHNEQLLELDEIPTGFVGKLQFEFVRNRPNLQLATALTNQAMGKASKGDSADAHELFQRASEIDPFDPNPIYQDGMVLMEMGLYAAAKDTFDRVDQLAPGWFRCRSDRWLAGKLEVGELTTDILQLLRVLDDGGLNSAEHFDLAKAATERFPEFAAFWLHLGDSQITQDKAIAENAYREGLKHAEEPDIESRLLCALAGMLPNAAAPITTLALLTFIGQWNDISGRCWSATRKTSAS